MVRDGCSRIARVPVPYVRDPPGDGALAGLCRRGYGPAYALTTAYTVLGSMMQRRLFGFSGGARVAGNQEEWGSAGRLRNSFLRDISAVPAESVAVDLLEVDEE